MLKEDPMYLVTKIIRFLRQNSITKQNAKCLAPDQNFGVSFSTSLQPIQVLSMARP